MRVAARPRASVGVVAVTTLPPAETALKVTSTPDMTPPSVPRSSTANGVVRVSRALPVWPPPLNTDRVPACGTTVTFAVPTTPLSVFAVIVTAPRGPRAVTSADAALVCVTRAIVVSLDVQTTARAASGVPPVPVAVAITSSVAPGRRVASPGETATVFAAAPGPTYCSTTATRGRRGSRELRAVRRWLLENSRGVEQVDRRVELLFAPLYRYWQVNRDRVLCSGDGYAHVERHVAAKIREHHVDVRDVAAGRDEGTVRARRRGREGRRD